MDADSAQNMVIDAQETEKDTRNAAKRGEKRLKQAKRIEIVHLFESWTDAGRKSK